MGRKRGRLPCLLLLAAVANAAKAIGPAAQDSISGAFGMVQADSKVGGIGSNQAQRPYMSQERVWITVGGESLNLAAFCILVALFAKSVELRRYPFYTFVVAQGAEVLSGIARLSGALHFLTAPDSHEICWEGVVLYYGDLVRSLAVATLSTLFGVVIFRYASRSFIPTHAAASLALGSRIALFVAWLLPLGLFLYWTFGSLWKLDGGRNATYTFGCSPLSAATDIASFLPFIFVFSLVYLVVAASLSIFALRKRKEMTAAVTTDPRGVFEYMQPVGYHLRLVLAFFFDPISWIPAFVIRFIPSAPLWLGDLNIACSAMRGPLAFLVFFLSLRLYKPPSRPTSERHVSTPGVGSAKRIASQKNNIFQPFIEPTSGSDME